MRLLFELLAELHPPAFRRRFGDELVERALGDVEDARRRGSWAGAVAVVATTWDLLGSAMAERLRPTWIDQSDSNERRDGMRTTMGHWMRHLKLGARTLGRTPAFTLAAVGTLALALGANTAIFAVADQVVFDPLPFEDSDELVDLSGSAPGSDLPEEFGLGLEFYLQFSEESDRLESVSTYNSFTATLRLGERVERARMSVPTPSLFTVLRGEPILGRLPTTDDRDSAVLTHAAWVDWFGQDPDVVGRSVWAMDGPKTVIGVMGPDFRFPDDGTLLWIPREPDPTDGVDVGQFSMNLVGRLAPGSDHESLSAELSILAARIPGRFGGSPAYARTMERFVPVVRSLEDEVYSEIAGAVWVLLAAVVGVLLIACANVANLFAVRVETRGRELAVRRALGAGRGLLVGSQMAEATLVAVLAGAAAIGIAFAALPLLLRWAPAAVPGLQNVHLSGVAVLLTMAATVGAALLCGLIPAVRAARPELARLRDGTRGSTGRKRWGRDGLVVGQTALALVLLIGSGLLLRSFAELRDVDPGYDTEDIFTFQFAPDQDGLDSGPAWQAFHMDMLDRIRALPGVESVGIVENVPLDEGLAEVRILPEESAGDPESGARLNPSYVGGDYFETMGISLLQGRTFDESDLAGAPVAILSRAAAERIWSGGDPLGRRIRTATGEQLYTVVGVVEDIVQYDFRDRATPIVYLPIVGPDNAWWMTSPGYVVKTPGAASIGPDIRAIVRRVAPEAPMYRTYTMDGLADRSMAELRFTMFLLLSAAALALVLGAVGLYGTLSYVVSRRTREIGVRMALGAEAGRVRRMIVGQGTRVVALGVVIGLVASLVATRALGSLLFGVQALDPVTFTATSLTMLGVGLLASYLPARRASAVAPVESMRES